MKLKVSVAVFSFPLIPIHTMKRLLLKAILALGSFSCADEQFLFGRCQ
jgi:hypothetical protein